MRKFSWSTLLILVLMVTLCACSGNDDGNDSEVVRYWGAAELIESNDGSTNHPQIAMSADGTAMAVWRQHDGTSADRKSVV